MAQLAATWFVYKDGANYKRVQGKTGTETTNVSFATIINGAIDAAATLTHGGRVVLTGEDTFTLASAAVINLKSKVTLEGQGHGSLITKGDTGHAISIVGVSGTEIVNWAVKNLRVVGPSVNATRKSGCGIFADFADKGLIESVDISGFGSSSGDGSVHLRRCEDVIVTGGSRLHDSLNGFITSESTAPAAPETQRVTISDSYCYNNWADGIHGQHSARLNIINNHCYNNIESGIDLLGDDSDIVVGNDVYSNVSRGIEIGNTTSQHLPDRYHTIVGNTVRDNGDRGIDLQRRTQYCTVSANICKNNTLDGIRLAGAGGLEPCEGNIVSGNLFEGNLDRGIYIVNAPTNDNYIALNIVRNNGGRGIHITSTSTGLFPANNVVTLNQVKGNTTADIADNIVGSTNKVFQNILWINSAWSFSPSLSEQLACSFSILWQNDIGTSYIDMPFPYIGSTLTGWTNSETTQIESIDFTNKTKFRAQWYHFATERTGTESVKVVNADIPTDILFEVTGISSNGKKTVALTALPAWAVGIKNLKIMALAGGANVDLNIRDMHIYLL